LTSKLPSNMFHQHPYWFNINIRFLTFSINGCCSLSIDVSEPLYSSTMDSFHYASVKLTIKLVKHTRHSTNYNIL
jgi:hypothetical protein